MMDQNVTARLAEFAVSCSRNAIPTDVRQAAKLAIVDSMSTLFAGLHEPAVEMLFRLAASQSGPGRASVIGRDMRLAASHAAFANAAAAHIDDFDSLSLAVSGFVATPVLFALLAVAQELPRVSGAQLVDAFIVGYEVEAAIARGLGVSHYAKGWHSTATLAHFGAGVATARILGLNVERMRSAIGIAASEASGLRNVVGNMLKPLHAGKAARNGVTAGLLARDGFIANPSALEGKGGFCEAFNGTGNYDLKKMVVGLGERWDLRDPGLVIKVYPCCGLLHSALDGALSLLKTHQFKPDEIREVELAVHELVPATTDKPDPQSGHEAKFSASYCVAAALVNGRLGLDDFEDERVHDPSVRALMPRVQMKVHPDLRGFDMFLLREFTDVGVTLNDGRRYTKRIQRLNNRGSPSNPIGVSGARQKYEACIQLHASHERALPGLELLLNLDELGDIRALENYFN